MFGCRWLVEKRNGTVVGWINRQSRTMPPITESRNHAAPPAVRELECPGGDGQQRRKDQSPGHIERGPHGIEARDCFPGLSCRGLSVK